LLSKLFAAGEKMCDDDVNYDEQIPVTQ
jgi:hypothetical protein